MGTCQTKDKKKSCCSRRPSERAVIIQGLKNKVRLLQGEIDEIMCIRDAESQVYKRELMAFAFKQAEWKRDRKRLKEEVRKLRKALEEKDKLGTGSTRRRSCRGVNEEEMSWRDETVEKWKQLYFAIKVELDDLIKRTHQEERVCWKTEQELSVELKGKEERIQFLQSKLASMEHQGYERERGMDILRQSMRILSYDKSAQEF